MVGASLCNGPNAVHPWIVVLIVGAAVMALVPAFIPVQGQGQVRYEALDDHWVWGNLTWNEGRGAIRWNPAPDSEDLGGHATKDANPSSGPDVFVSPPLAGPIYVNAAHLLQLDLLLSTSPDDVVCPGIRIYADNQLWAGATGESPIDYRGANQERENEPTDVDAPPAEITAPVPPEGFAFCLYRMPVEVVYLPRGTIVSLHIVYGGGTAYAIGTHPDHASILRVPVFFTEQAVYRMPDIVPRWHPASGQDPGPGMGGFPALPWGLGAAAIAFPMVRRGKPRNAAFATVLVLSSLLAGCMGPRHAMDPAQGSPAVGAAVVSYGEAGETGIADNATGGLIGRISDPFYLPLSDAQVAVLGTARSGKTDADGLFSFKLMPLGTVRLRVDKDEYKGAEVEVEIRSNQIAQVEVALDYAKPFGDGNRPHRHDYWGSESEATVFNGPVRAAWCAKCWGADTDPFFPRPSPQGDHNLIRPGTSEVEVALTWDVRAFPWARVGLKVQSNEDPNPNHVTYFLPRKSGEPFHIKTTWEMTDAGHQLFSTWMLFAFSTYDEYSGGSPPTCDVSLQCPDKEASLTTKITIHRGSLPLEPAHPDHWRGRTNLVLDGLRTWQAQDGGCLQDAPFTCHAILSGSDCHTNTQQAQNGLWQSPQDPDLRQRPIWPVFGTPGKVVPLSTKELVLQGNQERANGLSPGPTDGLVLPEGGYGWRLFYKTGESPPEPYVRGSPMFKEAPTGQSEPGGRVWRWHIPVTDPEADGIYNKKSAWLFQLVPDNQDAACTDAMQDRGPGMITFSLTAVRETS